MQKWFHLVVGKCRYNIQKEYYLTDIVEILRSGGEKAVAYKGAEFEELLGVNSPEQLEKMEELLDKIKTKNLSWTIKQAREKC